MLFRWVSAYCTKRQLRTCAIALFDRRDDDAILPMLVIQIVVGQSGRALTEHDIDRAEERHQCAAVHGLGEDRFVGRHHNGAMETGIHGAISLLIVSAEAALCQDAVAFAETALQGGEQCARGALLGDRARPYLPSRRAPPVHPGFPAD